MNIRIIEKKYEPTNAMREKMEKKILKFDKFFASEVSTVIVLKSVKDNEICEVTMNCGETIFRVEETTSDMYSSFDSCIENLKKQIRKYKTKIDKRLKDKTTVPPVWEELEYESLEEETEFSIIKNKEIDAKPMFPEEAILQMNLIGHEFFVFRNAETNRINIVYKRKDGNYGLIETK